MLKAPLLQAGSAHARRLSYVLFERFRRATLGTAFDGQHHRHLSTALCVVTSL